MTITVQLSKEQTEFVLNSNRKAIDTITNAARANAISGNQYAFFAAFDGTCNTLDNNPPCNAQTTNVAQLWTQFAENINDNRNLGGGYYQGPGTPGTLRESAWLAAETTQQVNDTAKKAFDEFIAQASRWLADPTNAGGTVAVALTAFSRGNASAALFCRMLHEQGMVDPNSGNALIAPGEVPVAAGVLFDPVTTGVAGNMAFAANASNIVLIRAASEYRTKFRFTDYSSQGNAITTVDMYGNHCDIGGGYDNVLAALTLQAATAFLQKSGLSIGDVPDSRRFDANRPVLIHDEGFDGENKKWTEDHVTNSVPPVSYFTLDTSGPRARLKDNEAVIKT